ncbi:NAD-dependent epimerase/dehydratase family protein [Streptacidiphilus monticola]
MTTILVTGATGQVGRSLVPRLLQWTAADRPANRPPETVRLLVRDEEQARRLEKAGAEVVLGDLRDASARAEALRGADAVVNVAAAFRGVPEEEAWAVNHHAAVALGREAAASGVRRFVHTSTNLVYPSGLGRPAREDDEPAADAAWGACPASKIASERGLREVKGLPLVVLRLAFVYGEGDSTSATSFRGPRTGPPTSGSRRSTSPTSAPRFAARCARRDRGRDVQHRRRRRHHRLGPARVRGCPLPRSPRRDDMDPWDKIPSTDHARKVLGWQPQYPTVLSAQAAGAL